MQPNPLFESASTSPRERYGASPLSVRDRYVREPGSPPVEPTDSAMLQRGLSLQQPAPQAGPLRTDDLLAKLVEMQKAQDEERKCSAEAKKTERDKRAKLERRRQRQDRRHTTTFALAISLAIMCTLLAMVLLMAMLWPPVNNFMGRSSARGQPYSRRGGACWDFGPHATNRAYICNRWELVYGYSISLGFMLEMIALMLSLAVAMGWTSRLHSTLFVFTAGTWSAAVGAMSVFWLSYTMASAIFATSVVGTFILASMLLLPTVVMLPLAWLASKVPLLGRRARALDVAGLDCSHAGLLHWAAARYTSTRRVVTGTLLRLLAMTDEDLDAPDVLSPLFIAAYSGAAPAVRVLLAAGADPDHTFYSYLDGAFFGLNFPLKAAAARGHAATMRELLRFDADPNLQDSQGRTALHAAAEGGYLAVVDLLLRSGASAQAIDGAGRTPLFAAAEAGHVEVVEALLRAGANPNAADLGGFVPLQVSVAAGHSQVVEVLLAAGADPKPAQLGEHGISLLQAAAAEGSSQVVSVLLASGSDPNTTDLEDGSTPLLAAAAGGHLATVEALLAAGALPNAPDLYGRTPLQAAVVGGHDSVSSALLAAGADPNTADRNGYTPLHVAVVGGKASLVALLLQAGADPNVPDLEGNAPLHVAATAGNLDVVRAFRDHSSKVDWALQNAAGATPRSVAAASGWHALVPELGPLEASSSTPREAEVAGATAEVAGAVVATSGTHIGPATPSALGGAVAAPEQSPDPVGGLDIAGSAVGGAALSSIGSAASHGPEAAGPEEADSEAEPEAAGPSRWFSVTSEVQYAGPEQQGQEDPGHVVGSSRGGSNPHSLASSAGERTPSGGHTPTAEQGPASPGSMV